MASCRVAVLHSNPHVSWTSRRLLEALSRSGCEAHYILWDTLAVTTGPQCHVLYRGRCRVFDAVIVRSLGRSLTPEKLLYRYTVLRALERDNVAVVNPPEAIMAARNKLETVMRLRQCGIPVPPTLATENPALALRAVKEYGKAVIKPIMGSLGLGSFLVDNVDVAYYVVSLLYGLSQPLYVQRYIEKEGNRDIRVFVVKDEPIASIYRVSGHWKTNVAQGAKALPAHDEEAEALAVSAAKCLGLYYAGVDIVVSKDGARYVLEANASPLWRGLYRATGVDPAKAITEMVREIVRERRLNTL